MEQNGIKSFIKNILDELDISNSEYKNLIDIKDVEMKYENNMFTINFKENDNIVDSKKASLLGVFDTNSKLWLWSWAVPSFSYDETFDSQKILQYGLHLEPRTNSDIHYYIKPHLINSRLYFENNIFLDIQLALSLYISKKVKFIYPRIKEEINGKKLIVYYLIY